MFAQIQSGVIKPKKVSQQIISKVRDAIVSHELEEGQKLPNESELMQYFGVSRQTMREALCALESMGLLKIKSGVKGGAFVCSVDMQTARDSLNNFLCGKNFTIANLTEVRLCLEPYAAKTAALHMPQNMKLDLRDCIENCRKAIDRGDDISRIRRLEIAFHECIVKSTDNPLFILLHSLSENMIWNVKTVLKTKPGFSKDVLERHEKILNAIENCDPHAAQAYMREDILHVSQELEKLADAKINSNLL